MTTYKFHRIDPPPQPPHEADRLLFQYLGIGKLLPLLDSKL